MTPDKPGVYHDIPDKAYFALPFQSHSGLQEWVNGKPTKIPKSITQPGCLVETFLLEPGDFHDRYHTIESDLDEHGKHTKPFSTKDGKAWLKVQMKGHEGKEAVRPEDYDRACNMARALMYGNGTQVILDAKHKPQVTIIAELCGVMCKVKLDMLIEHEGIVIGDIKTSSATCEEEFFDSIVKYGYASQAAMYCDAHKAVPGGTVPRDYYNICVSKTARDDDGRPCVWRVQYSPQMLAFGRRWYQDALKLKSRHEDLLDSLAQIGVTVKENKGRIGDAT